MQSKFSFVIFVAIFFGISATTQAQEDNQVWVWNSKCNTPINIALQVKLDGKEIFSTSLPLCQWKREFEDGKASFKFTPTRTLVWYGYRSDEEDGKEDKGDPTPAGTALEIEFWQAGGEADEIELDYSVSASDGLHMNSIHLLSPTKKINTTMAPGLILETQPEKAK